MERKGYDETLVQMYKDGFDYKEMAKKTMEMFDLDYEHAYNMTKNRFRKLRKHGLIDSAETEKPESTKKSMSYSAKDNSTTYEAVINVPHDKPLTPDIIMKAHNLESALWEVVSYKSNLWQVQTKAGTKMDMYQTKLTVKPRKSIELSISDIDEYFKNVRKQDVEVEVNPIHYETKGDTLVIKVPDLHIGLLAWSDECGNSYDLKIAKKNFLYCIADVVDRCKGKKIKKIVFATLGDILHTDNNESTTAHGTLQQTDGRLGKIIESAETMMVEAIEMLKGIAPIEYIYVQGNHDTLSGYLFAKMLENRYCNSKNITFDVRPNPIKDVVIGKTLIIFHHGDAPTKNIEQAGYNFCREQVLSDIKWIEMDLGHLHEKYSYMKDGIAIRHMPSLCSSSYWEHQQLYKGDGRCMICDIYNDELGKRETWQSNL